MKLYHFTARHLAEQIKIVGLTLGAIPVQSFGRIAIVRGYIWLTENPEPSAQTWDTGFLIPYSRTEIRLTVEIPHEEKLKTMDDIKKLYRLPDGFFERQVGNWYAYKGKIFPQNIIEYTDCTLEKRPVRSNR